MKDKKAVKLMVIAHIKEMRDFCRSYVDDWRQVPWMAAEANGRDGYSQNLTRACVSGVWLVKALTQTGEVHAYVDLLTGELIDSTLFHRDRACVPIKDMAVLPYGGALDRIYAPDLLHQLKIAADKPYAPGSDPERAKAWREHIRSTHNVKPVYDATAIRIFD